MMRPRNLSPVALLGGGTRSLGTLPTGEEVYHLPAWGKVGDIGRLKIIRKLIDGYARDPRLRTMAAGIISRAGAGARQYAAQADAILQWARKTVTYLNEPGELLQSPWYTLGLDQQGRPARPPTADCDDFVLLIGSLLESIKIPTRMVLSGATKTGQKVRYVEGQGRPRRGVRWSHIYLMAGVDHPFSPTRWVFMEPTLNVPLGWEVVKDGGRGALPELSGAYGAPWGVESNESEALVAEQQRRASALEWIRGLPWTEIIAGTLPMVLSAIVLDRYYGRRK